MARRLGQLRFGSGLGGDRLEHLGSGGAINGRLFADDLEEAVELFDAEGLLRRQRGVECRQLLVRAIAVAGLQRHDVTRQRRFAQMEAGREFRRRLRRLEIADAEGRGARHMDDIADGYAGGEKFVDAAALRFGRRRRRFQRLRMTRQAVANRTLPQDEHGQAAEFGDRRIERLAGFVRGGARGGDIGQIARTQKTSRRAIEAVELIADPTDRRIGIRRVLRRTHAAFDPHQVGPGKTRQYGEQQHQHRKAAQRSLVNAEARKRKIDPIQFDGDAPIRSSRGFGSRGRLLRRGDAFKQLGAEPLLPFGLQRRQFGDKGVAVDVLGDDDALLLEFGDDGFFAIEHGLARRLRRRTRRRLDRRLFLGLQTLERIGIDRHDERSEDMRRERNVFLHLIEAIGRDSR